MVATDGEYNLGRDRYRENDYIVSHLWPMVKVRDACDAILSGGTPSTKKKEFWNGDIPWITSADISDIRTAEPKRFITREAIDQSATNLIPKGNVVVVTRVGLGKLFTTSFNLCISQDSQGLILKGHIDAQYLAYVLKPRVEEFKHVSQGSTIPGRYQEAIGRNPNPLAPTAGSTTNRGRDRRLREDHRWSTNRSGELPTTYYDRPGVADGGHHGIGNR